jgi:hypothetical protein
MPHAPTDVRSLARQQTIPAINKLTRLMNHAESESVQMGCAVALLERGWGKAPQAITGADGDGDVRVIIRHIVRGVTVEERPMIDVSPPLTKTEGE